MQGVYTSFRKKKNVDHDTCVPFSRTWLKGNIYNKPTKPWGFPNQSLVTNLSQQNQSCPIGSCNPSKIICELSQSIILIPLAWLKITNTLTNLSGFSYGSVMSKLDQCPKTISHSFGDSPILSLVAEISTYNTYQ